MNMNTEGKILSHEFWFEGFGSSIKFCWANGFGNLWKESSSGEKLLLPSLGKRKGDGVPRKREEGRMVAKRLGWTIS